VIILGVNEWCQIAADAIDDPEQFWAFLDELGELPGLRAIAPANARDLWHLFQRNGVFYHRGDRREHLPPPDPGQAWEECARVDLFDAILYQLDLPPLHAWPYRRPGGDDTMAVGSLTPRHHVLLHPDPPLALGMGHADDGEADLAVVSTLADAIAAGLSELSIRAGADDATARAGWIAWIRAFTDRPVHIELVAHTGSTDRPIRLGGLGEQLIVACYHPLLRPRDGSREVHDQLGQVLADAVAATIALRTLPEADDQTYDSRILRDRAPHADEAGQRFIQAWKDLPLALHVMHPHLTLHIRPQAPGARVGALSRARAQRDVTNWPMRPTTTSSPR
jgi:hypothetical protein